MNIELSDVVLYAIKDSIMIEFLKDDLDTLQKSQMVDWHEDDLKENKKLIKAYKLILKYYGVDNG